MRKSLRKYAKRIIVTVLLMIVPLLYSTVPAFAAGIDSIIVSVTPGWGVPTLTTVAPGSSEPPVVLTGDITITGGCAITQIGFVWSLTSHEDPGDTPPENTDYEFNWTLEGEFGEGKFYHQPQGLKSYTDYYGRATALFDNEWVYGGEIMFDPIPYDVANELAETILPILLMTLGMIFSLVVIVQNPNVISLVIIFVIYIISTVGVISIQAAIP